MSFLLIGVTYKSVTSEPQYTAELRTNIRAEIIAILSEMLAKVMENAAKGAHFSVANQGGHLIVFKKISK